MSAARDIVDDLMCATMRLNALLDVISQMDDRDETAQHEAVLHVSRVLVVQVQEDLEELFPMVVAFEEQSEKPTPPTPPLTGAPPPSKQRKKAAR